MGIETNKAVVYFETSAVNAVVEAIKRLSADGEGYGTKATRELQLSKGRDWRLSPVTLWEILLTSDVNRRDELVEFCQHLFSRDLLPQPGEILVPWIEAGMPRQEPRRGLTSTSLLANNWRSVVDDPQMHLLVDSDDLAKKARLIRDIGKDIYTLCRDIDSTQLSSFDLSSGSLREIIDSAPLPEERKPKDKRTYQVYGLSICFAVALLGEGMDFDNTTQYEFWKSLGISHPEQRTHYIVHHLTTLIYRGPFVGMALMAIGQSQKKFSRGLWFDCMPSIYLPYVELLMATDGHFEGFRGLVGEESGARKIIPTSYLELFRPEVPSGPSLRLDGRS